MAFEFGRHVTVGQYLPTWSVVHAVDPRIKFGLFLTMLVVLSGAFTALPNLIALAIVLAVTTLARIPLRHMIGGLRPVLPLLGLLILLQLAFRGQSVPGTVTYFEWWIVRITDAALAQIFIGALRLVNFLFVTSLMTMVISTTELTHAIESVFGPLQRLGVPVRELALVATIAVRFVPTLIEGLDRVAKAQASRLGEIGPKADWRPDRAARTRLPLIVPLFLSALRRGEDLVLAMEARGYVGGARRNRFATYHARTADWIVLAIGMLIGVWLLFAPWPSLADLWALIAP
jgi:energy-coupling factor transport system permease protein